MNSSTVTYQSGDMIAFYTLDPATGIVTLVGCRYATPGQTPREFFTRMIEGAFSNCAKVGGTYMVLPKWNPNRTGPSIFTLTVPSSPAYEITEGI